MHEIEQLTVRRDYVSRNVKKISKDLAVLNAQIQLAKKELSQIDEQIAAEKEKTKIDLVPPRVSDHAVIRYLERRHGFSFDDVRNEILTPSRIAAINAGAKAIVYDGMRFLVRDKTITTVMED